MLPCNGNYHEPNVDWLICRIKEALAEWVQMEKDFASLNEAFADLKEYVMDYFKNLDVQEEINNKLDNMAESGELNYVISQYCDEIQKQISELQNNTVKIGENQIIGWNMLSDEVKEKLQSGELRPIENDSITTEKIADYAVTKEKTDFFKRSSNLFNLYGATYYKYFTSETENGNAKLYDNNDSVISGFIPVKKNKTYYTFRSNVLSTSNTAIIFYDINKKYVGNLSATISPSGNLICTPTNDGFVKVNTDNKHTYGWYFGEEDISHYEYINYDPILYGKVQEYVENSIDYKAVNFIKRVGSYYLKSYGSNINKLIDINGRYIDMNNFSVSNIFMLKPGRYCVYHPSSRFGGNIFYFIATTKTQNLNTLRKVELTAIPNNTDWYEFSLESPTYVAMNYISESGLIVNDYGNYSMDEGYLAFDGIDGINKNSKLSGKSIALTGDSICEGVSNDGGYGILLQNMYNMSVQNIAKSGGTITRGILNDAGAERFCISDSVNRLNSSDYILLEGGVNDSSLNVPLGELTSGYTETLDSSTFYGAFENMLKQTIINFNAKKIGYLFTHKMSANFLSPNGTYYKAAKECCEKWGVPYLDLNTECIPLNYLPDNIKEKYTLNGDGWHPNNLGYITLYLPKIVSFLESL